MAREQHSSTVRGADNPPHLPELFAAWETAADSGRGDAIAAATLALRDAARQIVADTEASTSNRDLADAVMSWIDSPDSEQAIAAVAALDISGLEPPPEFDEPIPWEPEAICKPRKVPYLVIDPETGERIIEEGIQAVLSGLGASGKTQIISDIVFNRAAAVDGPLALGKWAVEPGHVLHVHMEDSELHRQNIMHRWVSGRIGFDHPEYDRAVSNLWRNYRQIDVGKLAAADRRLIVPMSGTGEEDRHAFKPGKLLLAAETHLTRIGSDESVLVVFDPIPRMMGGLPETNETMLGLSDSITEILTRYPRATFLLVTHVAKNAGGPNGMRGSYAARGGGSLVHSARWGANLDPLTKTQRRHLEGLAEADPSLDEAVVSTAKVLNSDKINRGRKRAWIVAYRGGVFDIICEAADAESAGREKLDLGPPILDAMGADPEHGPWTKNAITEAIKARTGKRPNDGALKERLMELVEDGHVNAAGNPPYLKYTLADVDDSLFVTSDPE